MYGYICIGYVTICFACYHTMLLTLLCIIDAEWCYRYAGLGWNEPAMVMLVLSEANGAV